MLKIQHKDFVFGLKSICRGQYRALFLGIGWLSLVLGLDKAPRDVQINLICWS
jgi:hypothetical protein